VAVVAAVKLADGARLELLRDGAPLSPATCASSVGGLLLVLRRSARVAAWLPVTVAATAPAGRARSPEGLDADCRATVDAVAAGEPAAVASVTLELGAFTAATVAVGRAPV